jgi:hypothetical protein
MTGVKLTPEQQSIVDFVDELFANKNLKAMAIKAFAGCGKSFVLKYIANKHTDKKILGLAFNSSIAKENKKEFPKRNSKWFTVHGFAREYLKKFNVNMDFKNSVSEYKPLRLIKLLGLKDATNYELGACINTVLKVYCQSSLTEITPENIRKAGKSQLNNDVITMNDVYLKESCKYAKIMWDKFENNEIPITFDFYLKYFEVNRFCERITEFDLVELDEAQDSNAVTMSIVTQLPTKNIYVGDEHQSIYAFRGTLNAMNFADKLFYLSTTFRYIPHIANFANKILNGYKLEQVPIKSLAPNVGRKDGKKAYLSRNNSSMISLIAKFVDEKIPFKTIKDPDEMFKMAIALYEFRTKNTLDECLKDFEGKDFDELKDYAEETKDNELLTALKMQLQYGGKLYIFKSIAVKYYKSKEDVDYYLSTAHTSKGLEWDEVELLGDFPDIQRMIAEAKITSAKELLLKANKKDLVASNIIQEINLYYVAVTRARFKVHNNIDTE